MIFYLIYLSKAVKLMQDGDLTHLLKQSIVYNDEHELTGLLIYIEGHFSTHIEGRFIQVLEGSQIEVTKLFEKIKNDNRHHHIILLSQKSIEERNFYTWKMGFESINLEEHHDIKGFFQLDDDFLKSGVFQESNAALDFLKSFYKAPEDFN